MIIVDSCVWVAFFSVRDEHHERAIKDLLTIKALREPLCITDYVVAEAATVLLNKCGKETSDIFVKVMLEGKGIRFISTDGDAFRSIAGLFTMQGKKLSFVDVSLIWSCENLGAKLLTYDKELRKAV